jgi:WD40 repeat protein
MNFPEVGAPVLNRKLSQIVAMVYEIQASPAESQVKIRDLYSVSPWGEIFSAHGNRLKIQQLEQKQPKVSTFSLMKFSFELFSDCAIQHLLRSEEFITVANFINTDSNPKYLIGTNFGKLYIVSMNSGAKIASFEYHKASVTCIFSTEEILVTASEDSTLCVWPLGVIERIES